MNRILNLFFNIIDDIKLEIREFFYGENRDNVKPAFFGAFLAALLCYTQFIINDYGSPDVINENAVLFTSSYWWMSLGRWFSVIINHSMGNVVVPVFSVIVNTCAHAITTIALDKMWSIGKRSLVFLTAFILTSAPAIVMTHLFIHTSVPYAFALLGAIIFAYFSMRNGTKITMPAAILFLAFSLGSYQIYIGVAVGTVLLTIILRIIKCQDKGLVRMAVKSFVLGILGCVLYIILMKVMQRLTGIAMAEYSGADEIGLLKSVMNFGSSFKNAYNYFFEYYFGDGYLTWALIIFAVFIIICSLILVIKKEYLRAGIVIILSLLIPPAINVICFIATERGLSSWMTYPMQLIIPFSLALFSRLCTHIYIYIYGRTVKLAAYTVIFGCALLCMNLVINAFATYKYVELSYRHTETIVSAALNRIYNLEEYEDGMKIIPIGTPDDTDFVEKNPLKHRSYYQRESAVFWKGDSDRTIWMQYLYRYFGVVTEYKRAEYTRIGTSEDVKNMPSFPHKDSVKISEDAVIIKFGEYRG